MLQPNNKTDSIVNAVLQGINGLFEHFGDDIEVSQLNSFYDTMTRECIKISKCFEVLLSIFKHHARLFREKLSKDSALRMYMWQFDNKSSLEALCSVYKVVLEASENPESILVSEVVPHTASRSVVIKLAALNIVILSGTRLTGEVTQCAVELELLLKNKKLSYEEANTISWSINSNASNSESMLLTAIMYSDNLPSSMRDDIIVNGILKASEDVRKTMISKQDIDYKVLSKVLSKIETSIENDAENLDKRQLEMIINQLKMLKSKSVMDTKDARIFQKDVTMFLGLKI
ncbi:hypothetical protein B5X24_HaOG202110 [Helicoverpa armigera]|uniref:Uncharacterized protein n=1 Tax=Helicoverpa armigera TaxID=29058 RepID=A0A2W1BY64_HELAM|nr:hypothetical protein B5X24_HaOG202110 [Helicoverpa armigera]